MVGDCVRRPLVTTFDHLCPPDNFAFVFGECDGVGWFISIPIFLFFYCKFFDPNRCKYNWRLFTVLVYNFSSILQFFFFFSKQGDNLCLFIFFSVW